jgi:hypothetical protein
MGDGSIYKTYTFSNLTSNYNYGFCFSPETRPINAGITMQYASTDYPQRIYNPGTMTLTNSTTNITLYLLGSSDGLYVTFQVLNLAGQTIEGVNVIATRTVGSTVTEVGNGLTDASGLVTFWFNPDFSHTVTFTKTGYDTFTTTLFPTQSSYTITMGGTTTTNNDYSQGISYFINPARDFLDNYTLYNFNFTINSDYWQLQGFGFSLYYGNHTLIGTNTSTVDTGGIVSLSNINTSFGQTNIYMNYFYLINGNYTNLSRSWLIQPTYGRNFSIWNFFQDLGIYIDSGFLGFDNFGKILLSFVLLVLISGGVAYNYGLRSEAAIMGIIFGVIFLLDVGLGFIPRIQIGSITAVPNFLTIVAFLLLIVFVIKEERS